MTNYRRFTACILFPLTLPAAATTTGKMPGQDALQEYVGPGHAIHGTVVDATPDCSREILTRLSAATSEEEFGAVLSETFRNKPVPDCMVTLQGHSLTRETVAGPEGAFHFTNLPRGEYELFAETPSLPSEAGEDRMASHRLTVRLDRRDQYPKLELRADRITVCGQITDADGRPVAGAKVFGIQEIVDPACMHYPNIVTTVSDAEGSYALQGLNPPNIWRTAGYLNGGDPTAGLHAFYLIVRVEAEDFVQRKEQVPRFPLVTGELLSSARSFLKALSQLQTRLEGTSDIKEKDGLGPFPASDGNTIPDIDIVLEPWPRASVSGRVLDTKGRPAAGRILELHSIKDGPPLPGDSDLPRRWPPSPTTDENGAFDIPSMIPGRYSVLVYRPSPIGGDRNMEQIPVQGEVIDVHPGARVTDFAIRVNPPEDFAVSGQVVDANEKPVCGLFVGASGDPHGRCWWTLTDEEGTYYIDGLDGIRRSTFNIGFGYGGLAIHDVTLAAGTVDLVIPDRGSIHGCVCDGETGETITTGESIPTAQKIANCRITVPRVTLPDSGAVWTNPDVQVEWAPDGEFIISNVPAGEVTVEIRADGFDPQQFETTVEPGKASSLECVLEGPTASMPE
jgi:protocatechuate 3,4-dioxygenase beta subunit